MPSIPGVRLGQRLQPRRELARDAGGARRRAEDHDGVARPDAAAARPPVAAERARPGDVVHRLAGPVGRRVERERHQVVLEVRRRGQRHAELPHGQRLQDRGVADVVAGRDRDQRVAERQPPREQRLARRDRPDRQAVPLEHARGERADVAVDLDLGAGVESADGDGDVVVRRGQAADGGQRQRRGHLFQQTTRNFGAIVQKHRVQSQPGSAAAATPGAPSADQPTRARYLIILILFVVSTINYADRATLSIVGTDLSRDLRLDAVTLGYLLSAFSWSYVALQIPGGWLLDRPGSRRVYRWSLLGWSAFTISQAGVGAARDRPGRRDGAVRPPAGAGRRRGAVLPGQQPHRRGVVPDRGARHGVGDLQRLPVFFHGPLLSGHGHRHPHLGWPWVFVVMGAVGLVFGLAWNRLVYEPADHPLANAAEVDYIRRGGGLVDLDPAGDGGPGAARPGPRAAAAADAARHLPRPVLHQRADLVLPDLVPDLPGPGTRHVDPAGRLRRRPAGALRLHRRHPRRLGLGHAAAARRPAQHRAQGADRRRAAAVDGDRRLQLRRRRSGR